MASNQNPGNLYPNTGGYPPQTSPSYPSQQQPQISQPYPGQQPTGGYPPTEQYPTPAVCPPGPGGGTIPGFQPTAPDISSIQPVPGYEGITYDQTLLPPPSLPDWQPDARDQKPIENLPRFTDEQVRDAAVQYASEHCCYSGAPARDMVVKEIQMSSAFHYKLETFAEKRTSSWKFEPYHGQPLDGPMNGRAPSPWEVMASPQNPFTNSYAKIEVPHTAFMRPCYSCVGNGRVRCEKCNGYGRKACTWCEGRGRRVRFDKEEPCSSCNASGYDRCFSCSGSGQVKCKTCDGNKNLKGFVELVITWTNHIDDYISEVACMPKELVRDVSGQNAFEEENPRVFPIVQGAEQAVCNASNSLITKHASAFTNERILKQRQSLRIVPIAQVMFEWKGRSNKFCVYGMEHKVYFSDYPQKCCCSIL